MNRKSTTFAHQSLNRRRRNLEKKVEDGDTCSMTRTLRRMHTTLATTKENEGT